MYQIGPGSAQAAWWITRPGGIIGQSGYQNKLNSFGTPTVYKNMVGTRTFYKNLVNGEHDLNLSINQNDNSEGRGQDGYDIGMRVNSAPNTEQVHYSVNHNIQNDDNGNTFLAKSGVDGNQKAQFNIKNEESGSISSVPDHDAMTLTDVDVIDQNNLDVAHEASLQDVVSEVSTDNVENTSNNILTEDQTLNWADETHSDHTVTVSGWNSDNVKNDLTSLDNEDIITDVEADIKDNTDTESMMTEKLISTGDKSPDRSGLNVADARLQKQLKEVSTNIDVATQLNYGSPLPSRNLYPVNQNNLNWETKSSFLVNGPKPRVYPSGFPTMNLKPNVYPSGLPPNQQHMIGYNMPWIGFYGNYQRPHPTYPYFTPRNVEWIIPSRENIATEQVYNLVSRICLNPNTNVKPGYEIFTRNLPRNMYENIPPQNLDIEYKLYERRPVDYDYADGALQPNLYKKFPFLYQRPLKVINFPGQFNRYIQRPYGTRELKIESTILRPNEAASNDPNMIDFTHPELQIVKNNYVAKHDFDTTNQIESLLTMNSKNMVRDGDNTPEASEKYVSQMIVDIATDLVKFPSSKCHSENVAKLLEGIKYIVDALKVEQCEITH
ncbi:uncharacterized protein LOC134675827 [Cydia fagiglandana]|uniref:uncharacterized protein LOC134675827 n=1 Tax=Cydia fagiglandana TaxID=1458189 RepID=UPI002FEE1D59